MSQPMVPCLNSTDFSQLSTRGRSKPVEFLGGTGRFDVKTSQMPGDLEEKNETYKILWTCMMFVKLSPCRLHPLSLLRYLEMTLKSQQSAGYGIAPVAPLAALQASGRWGLGGLRPPHGQDGRDPACLEVGSQVWWPSCPTKHHKIPELYLDFFQVLGFSWPCSWEFLKEILLGSQTSMDVVVQSSDVAGLSTATSQGNRNRWPAIS